LLFKSRRTGALDNLSNHYYGFCVAHHEPSGRIAHVLSPLEPPGDAVPRILVIDDDNTVVTAIKAVLIRSGFEVITAPGGKSALKAVEVYAFDLVIVDMVMEEIDGLETIRLLHEVAPKVPVIAVSGFMFKPGVPATADFLGFAEKLGIAYCLHKPFRPDELVAAVKTCIGAGTFEDACTLRAG
jgi:DNA-binding response OmpR family regulator